MDTFETIGNDKSSVMVGIHNVLIYCKLLRLSFQTGTSSPVSIETIGKMQSFEKKEQNQAFTKRHLIYHFWIKHKKKYLHKNFITLLHRTRKRREIHSCN